MSKCVAALVVAITLVGLVGCLKKPAEKPAEKVPDLIKPTLFISFDETCNVPDGMALDEDNNIILSVPNYLFEGKHPGKLMKLTIADGRPTASVFYMLPPHPETGKVHPMGLEFGPDGNIYVADNQYFIDKDYKSRLLKVIIEDGEAVGCEVAVDGFKLANAVRWKGNDCYVSDTFFDLKDKKNQSGIYRISLEEMNEGTVTLLPDAKDPRLVAQYTAKDTGEEETAGADGVCFDSEGDLYCGNYGDGVISKTTFDADGSVATQEIIVDDPSLECCDGICCDTRTDEVYITNSKNNSIHVLDTKTNKVRLLWVNDDDDGSGGLLDQPCEPLVRGDQLIVVNFDMTFPGLKNTVNDEHNTISVFKLK